MRKGDATRGLILDEAGELARRVGLGGLTIGALATQTGMSKSGLFAHFGSKESLQLQVLDHVTDAFAHGVVRPAVKEPRGIPRLRALFAGWLEWDSAAGGCPLVAAVFELDDQPGPVREHLVAGQRDWHETLATVVTSAITEGHFRADVDPNQVAFTLAGLLLSFHVASRLLGDPQATARAQRGLEDLIAAAAA